MAVQFLTTALFFMNASWDSLVKIVEGANLKKWGEQVFG